jgi:hypothetical protein
MLIQRALKSQDQRRQAMNQALARCLHPSKSAVSGKKRKSQERAAKGKKMEELPSSPPKPLPKSRSWLELKLESGAKAKTQAQSPGIVVRNYLEEIEFRGISKLVDIINLTEETISYTICLPFL